MCRHLSKAQAIDKWSKREMTFSAQRIQKRHGGRYWMETK
jgi:hypothetical protein